MTNLYLKLAFFLTLCCCCNLFANNPTTILVENSFDDVFCPGSDADEDGVCDADDVCPGFDDSIDENSNGIPDGCENGSTPSCIAFTFNPPDKTVACGSTISFDQPVAVDNCCSGTISYTFIDSEVNPNPGCQEFTRVWIAQSSCGNLATRKQTITYLDNEPPQFVIDHPLFTLADNCDTITVNCSDGFFIANDDVSVVDNCDPNPTNHLHDVITNGNCPNDGFTRFMLCYWVASDNCENRDTFKIYIKFVDNTAPNINCLLDVEVECGDDLDPANIGLPWVSDNCTDTEDINLSFVDATPVIDGCTTTIDRTWTATDECGNQKTCIQTIIQTDNTPPILTCPADQIIDCTITADPLITGTATATDECSSVTNIIYQDDVQVLDACQTQINRLWTTEDACGNSTSCVQIIISRDLTAPNIVCPPDVNLECGDSTNPADTGSPTATDNCDLNLEFAFTEETVIINNCEIIIERTWTAADNCNNMSSCMQLLKLTDTQPPSVVCPPNVTIECTDSTDPSNTGMATATDICDANVNLSFADVTIVGDCETVITRTWTATDACGNVAVCNQIITLTDTTAPMITCPANITVECNTPIDPNMTGGMAAATDNCDTNVEITFQEFMLVTTDCEILFNWVFTATDNCGNTATCSQLVNVNDSTPPEITCPANTTIECTASSDPTNTGTATGMDSCDDGVDIAYSDDTNIIDDCTTVITRTWTATNDCGAVTSCDQIITINDSQAPTISCPEDITVECDGANDPATTGMATATDNCDTDISITFVDVTTQINLCEIVIERTFTATDNCGNSVSCMQTIKVLDTTTPTIICPADQTVECNTSTDLTVTGEPTASDNCATGLTFTFVDVNLPIDDCSSQIERTWTTNDACGNETTCVQIITITDTTAPTLNCAPDMTIECDETVPDISAMDVTATDNCDTDVEITFGDIMTQIDDCMSEIKRTYTAEDNCGNQTTCVQFINIEDSVAPSITCPADIETSCDAPIDPANIGMATATDNCDTDLDLTFNDVTISITDCETIIERTWTAVDNCGNTATCTQTIKITDMDLPVITCPADASIECDMDMLPAALGMAIATDNCDTNLDISSADISTYADNCTEIFERTWTATDNCGNTATCVQTITVEDTTPPVIACPNDVTVECNTDFSIAVTGEATATDNCTIASVFSGDVSNVIDDCTTEVTRTFQAFDVCGNMSECSQIITITDTTLPTITCPQDMTIECDASTDPSNTGEPFAADNCDAQLNVTYVDDMTNPNGCITIINRTWTAVDNCGNQATCVQIIQIEDTTLPTITCPADVEVSCDAPIDPANTGMATATDNCDTDLDITFNDVTISVTDCETIIERTWTAVDNCGNEATCTQTIKITDTEVPVITCPADASIECDMDMLPATLGMAIATDNCDTDLDISSADVSTYADNCTEIFERTWTATDNCGNTATCVQTITVEDTTPPVIACPNDVTVECNTDFSIAVTGEATATDNCTIASVFSGDVSNAIDDCTTEVTRTFQAFDVCGNMSECAQIITITDTTLPTITCPQDMTIECDASTDPSNTGEPFAADNCDAQLDVTYMDDMTNPNDCITIINRTWTAVDNCGNQATCIQIIQVEDTTLPTITCPADVEISCDAPIDPANTGMATATDNCDTDLDISYNDITISVTDCETIIERTWTAVDNCGNAATCTQTIKINDTEVPVITCPADASIECNMDMSPAALGMATATDNCDTDLTISSADVSTYVDNCTEIFERTWTAVDNCGNTATCVQTITVEDTTPPVVTCPTDVTVECNTDFSIAVTGEATATDNCSMASIFPGDVSNVIDDCTTEVTRTFQAFDVCGNMSECSQIITITDTTLPTITCPQDMTIECDASTDPSNTGEPFAADNCDAQLDVTYADDVSNPNDCITIINRTWTATDNCGNQATCIQIIQVEDTTLPTITCPADVEISCDAPIDPANTGMATATDNCDTDLDISYNDITISVTACETIIERTWTAVDNCGNEATCTQTIKINDTEVPVITCPADASIECDMDMSPAALGMAIATDNCDTNLDISSADVSTYVDNCTEIFERTWTATDNCDNAATCVQTITVEDTTPPVVTCPTDVTVECNTDFSTAVTGEATATDNCTIASVFSGDVTNVIDDCTTEVTRTFQAFDVCGNMSECSQIITITDTTLPTITCPQDMTIECDASTDPSNTGEPFAADNCDAQLDVTYVDDMTNPDDCITIINRTWTAVDNCGNQATCIQIIQIEDATLPTISCPADVEVSCDAPIDPANTGMATATDNCDTDLDITFNDVTISVTACETIIERTWTAVDNCGNTATCTQTIKITDTEVPVITCPADASIECDMDMSPTALGFATATDNCDIDLDITSADVSTYADNCTEIFERTWTATDNCGNQATCVQTITVEDTTPPVVTCPNDVTVECNTDFSTAVTGEATATDNCSMASIFSGDVTNVIDDCTTEVTRTFQAFDVCGNMSECAQVITITDTTAPILNCAPDMTIECDATIPDISAMDVTATDNCDTDVEITFGDIMTQINDCMSEIKRTYTATDNCGNQDNCVQFIYIEDSVAPSITCPADVETNCNAPIDPANTGMATATDNCDNDVTITFNDATVSVTDCEIIYERTWTATDNCGNTATCIQLIKVTDTDTPVLTCPTDVTIDCTSMIDPSVTGIATAMDNCDTNLDIQYDDNENAISSCVTEITRTWTATDDCGNAATCTQIITVQDITAPQIFCPGDAVLTCDGDTSPANTGQAGATDNCDDSVDVTFVDNTVSVDDCTTTIERTWTATDDCGLTATCVQTITLTDTDTPIISCPADMTIECDASTDPTNTGMATATDNCDTDVTITFNDLMNPINACQMEIKRVWSAVDDCGQVALCTQTIIVTDTNAPVITCPADAAVSCGGSTDPADTGMATATDNCDADVTITFNDVTTTNTACDIVIERTWTATDNCNNATTCVQLISTSDSGAPVITCPIDILVECNTATDPISTGMATATDDCDNDIAITFTDDITVIDACETQIQRTWTATDDCGNSDSCTQIITVKDQTAPLITCPIDVTIDCTVDPIPATTGMATATDNCDNDVTITFTDEMMQTAACTETITRTWVATDDCGNTVSCVQTITQTDENAPVLTFNNPILNGSEHCDTLMMECGTVPTWTIDDVIATDICDATPTVTVTESSIFGNCLTDGFVEIQTVQWIAVDDCGNADTLKIIIKTQDTTPPVITPVDPAIAGTMDGDTMIIDCENFWFLGNDAVQAVDACGNATITFEEEIDQNDCFGNGLKVTLNCHWIAVDDCENRDTFTLIMIIVDNTAPALLGVPNDITVECANIPAPANVIADDGCDANPTLVFEQTENVNGPNDCNIVRKWTTMDECGNTATATQVITISYCVGCFTPLQSQFLDFEATAMPGERVDLKWTFTATPYAHAFIVQRSADDATWKDLGIVEGIVTLAGEQDSYQFMDESPREGNNYYRIKAINLIDGTMYSDSRYLRFDDITGLNVFVFPNPTIDEINVELVGETAGEVTVQVVNELGQVLIYQTLAEDTILEKVSLRELKNGVYFVYVTDSERRPVVVKVVKVN